MRNEHIVIRDWAKVVIDVLCSQALADHLGDVRDAEEDLWKLLGVPRPRGEFDSDNPWRNTRDRLKAAGLPLPEHLKGDDDEPKYLEADDDDD